MNKNHHLLFGALLLGAGCDNTDKPPASAPRERSQIVEAKAGDSAPKPTAAETVPAAASGVVKAPRALCAGQMSGAGRSVAKKPVSQSVAAGEAQLPDALPLGGGYTWVNFWAAWCKPCKEEIPRLMRFQQEVAKASPGFKIAFVSLDDDERQLGAFLAEQTSSGLRRTWWLKEGKEREDWLKAAALESEPDLPFHLLFDPKGKLRCVVKGAVEDADLPSLKQLVTL
ncbi:MAG: TlpA family protein disulfide reductase [Myxococcales bacterium]|nr:MAG: TlpA family protein disulfide reductase [Myxococcales bacterium]